MNNKKILLFVGLIALIIAGSIAIGYGMYPSQKGRIVEVGPSESDAWKSVSDAARCGSSTTAEIGGYYRDGDRIKYVDIPSFSADAKTFHFIGHVFEESDTASHACVLVAVDQDHVYVGGDIPDPTDLREVSSTTPLMDVHTASVIGGNYLKDAHRVYYFGDAGLWYHLFLSPIPDADPKTFEVISEGSWRNYARDARYVYLNGSRVAGADPKTFKAPVSKY